MVVFWLICFVVLFAATEFYRWLIHLIGVDMISFDVAELPLPVYILAGVALAIASNYSRQTGFPFQMPSSSPPPTPEISPQPAASNPTSESSATRSIAATSAPTVQVHSAEQLQPHSSTISYTIDKENHRSERRPKSP